jgi:hypothetical protein
MYIYVSLLINSRILTTYFLPLYSNSRYMNTNLHKHTYNAYNAYNLEANNTIKQPHFREKNCLLFSPCSFHQCLSFLISLGKTELICENCFFYSTAFSLKLKQTKYESLYRLFSSFSRSQKSYLILNSKF